MDGPYHLVQWSYNSQQITSLSLILCSHFTALFVNKINDLNNLKCGIVRCSVNLVWNDCAQAAPKVYAYVCNLL